VLIEAGRPSEMIVTSTNLLAKKAVNPWREDDELLQFRKVYRVPFADERMSRELLERTAGTSQPEPWQKALKDTNLFRPSLLLPRVYGEQFGSS
jgi:hypothetical protein